MSLRGDFDSLAAGREFVVGGFNEHYKISVARCLSWNLAFFIGALSVFGAGVGAGVHWVRHLAFAPATFFSEICLLVFGFIMIVLELPGPHERQHRYIKHMRINIGKFALFMTRFVGRGVWYIFLATMVFGALWSTGISWLFGAMCTGYLAVLGICATGKGLLMTMKLNRVRNSMKENGYAAERFVPRGEDRLNAHQFEVMIQGAVNQQDLFAHSEISCIIRALSFMPFEDGHVSLEELKYWLEPGPALLV